MITTYLKLKIIIEGEVSLRGSWNSTDNFIDDIGDDFFLNNNSSRHWRIPRTPADEYSLNRSNQIEEFQIIVDKEGIYKISYEYLINQLDEYFLNNELNNELAFDWDDIDPRYLELTCEDNVVPIHFSGESDGSFDPGDYFEFYGQRHSGDVCYYDDYTAENVYNLRLNNYLGSRMAVENGGLEENNSSNFYIPDSFQETVYFEEQLTMDHLGAQFVYTSNDYYREDIWFWKKISAPNLEIIPFEIEYPHESNIRTYSAEISLFGLTYNKNDYEAINHHAIVRINNSIINNLEWYGQNEQIFQNQSPLPNSYLHHGENILYVSLPGVPGVTNEQVALDYLELTYWRRYMTDRDEFRFSKPQNRPNGLYQFELENFTTDQVFVYKLGASFMENLQIEPFSETGEAPYKVSFQDYVISNEIDYYVVSEEKKKQPVLIRPNLPSSLKDPLNKAELVILTTEEFINSEGVAKYNEIWESQGYHVITVTAEDVYDEFNNGIRSAEAIKDFFAYAYHNWSDPLISHVLLLGDGILDERDFSVDRKYNIIPFRRIWADKIGAIASDNWFACFIGDDPVPDISISRITNWNESQILDCANKSESYLNNPNYQNLWHSHVILSAGGNPSEGSFFAKQCERINEKWIPEDYHVTRVYCNTTDLPQSYYGNTTKLITNINKGALYLSFMGHGGGQVWADYNLLNMADIRTLNNQNYPFVSSLSCYASAFNYPQSACIGEELILVADKGAIGQVGFTGYGYLYADEIFGNYLTEAIFTKQLNSVGEIISFTKAKFYGSYGLSSIGIALTQGCALLGDPMIRLTPPHTKKPVLLSQYNLAVGDTLVISSPVGPDINRGKFLIYDEFDSQLPLDQYYPFEMPVINDTLWSSDFIVPQTADDIYSRKVKIFAFGDTMEVTGITEFTVGMSAAANIQIIPEIPTQADTIHFQADFFDLDGIETVECVVLYESTLPMNNIDGNTYRTVQPLSPMSTGTYVEYYFNIYDQEGESTATEIRNFTISGPDLFLQGFELTTQNYQPVVKTKIQNIGSQESSECILKLYDILSTQTLISEITVAPLAIMEERWEYLPIPLLTGEYEFKLFANENQQAFTEYFYPSNNQVFTDAYTINMFEAGLEPVNASSIDGNFECMFPANLLSENAVFYLNNIPYLTPLNQPDISTITLADSSQSSSYEINLLNQDLLADSLGHFPAENRVMLSFNYSSQDSLIQLWENNGTFAVYRYQENYNKWIFQGGEIYPEEDKVNYFTDKIGIYTILINNDDTPPRIEANVEGQEFTNGGYVSKNGVISFLLSDENGIDVFNNTIYLEVDGINIPASDY
ncbi:MAG: hypothetical protein JW996_06310, partial [Candidatus Cloacimonetes bacterium]|nr:hypothetical protein [Candidatus Cloacimonadota bacterium]